MKHDNQEQGKRINSSNKLREQRLKQIPNTLRSRQKERISYTFNNRCALTDKESNIHYDHFVPVQWGGIVRRHGIGGTTYANIIPLHRSINASKSSMNPFIWFERYGDRHGVTLEKWNRIVDYIAGMHGMTTIDYINRVNTCYCEYLAIRWVNRISQLVERNGTVRRFFIDNALRNNLNIHIVVELFGSLEVKEYFNNNETIELVKERKHTFFKRI
ncbi:hypothetical protein KB559_20585 [Paenibacillus sp. Marseille-P2973]|uniref:hypothetical protein n=1 Tax=Paenibacillus sp. Marseille-P2973 TaxID=1871032 RepID=UPI001B363F09|nr:hypothetical protein [Paenibacillus sp. Marseille-P2973]MBQ4901244.1 hypothetical protein [Paenibacillus sp. Marseille-P2973]